MTLRTRSIVMIALFLTTLLVIDGAFAHGVGTSYIAIKERRNETQARVDLHLRDLAFAVGLDLNRDGQITVAEIRAHRPYIEDYVRDRLIITRGDERCELLRPRLEIEQRSDGPYAAVSFEAPCQNDAPMRIHSTLLFDIDAHHRTLLSVTNTSGSIVSVLTSQTREYNSAPTAINAWPHLSRFIMQGVWHIWTGYDHLAFVLLLILPLALQPKMHTRVIGVDILQVVTAFTLAHSMTLACAALNYIQLPSRLVEATIAASIVAAAACNLLIRSARLNVSLAFGFGLIHGLGFASALAEITANTASRVLPLVGFNIGVELGQLIVVSIALPALLLTRRSAQLQARTSFIGSVLIGIAGLVWLIERSAS